MPNGREGRPWLIAVLVALLVPSVTSIVIIAQMHQKLTTLEMRQARHEEILAHGLVLPTLKEHDTRLDSQEKSLDTVRHSNDRLSKELHEIESEQRLLRHRLNAIKQRLDSKSGGLGG